MITVITPDRVVIGGGVAAAGDLLLDPIRAEVRRRVHDDVARRGRDRDGRAGTWAGAIGAAIHGAEPWPADRARRRPGRLVPRGARPPSAAGSSSTTASRPGGSRSRTGGSPRSSSTTGRRRDALPYIAPGFVDVHVHGWGGHDAMGGRAALDGMARALLRAGVTSFLPTAVTAPLDDARRVRRRVREWLPARARRRRASRSGSTSRARSSRRAEARRARRRAPAGAGRRRRGRTLEPLLDGLRLITIAPGAAGRDST